MSTIAIAILVLLALAGASGYLSFKWRLGHRARWETWIGSYRAMSRRSVVVWCLWWSS